MTKEEHIQWLTETDERRLADLWKRADDVRKRSVGEEVHLRGLIEISNYCERRCAYCGINMTRRSLDRYRMTRDEVLSCVFQADEYGYGTVVIQAGEDYGIEADWVADLVSEIKRETSLAVTLSLGERASDEWRLWRAAGADRYLLRFETSNSSLYKKIHSAGKRNDTRIDQLMELRSLGYEIGSGVMVGVPGQTYEDLANDIMLFSRFDLDMIGVGPFIPHPETPLGQAKGLPEISQVPNTEDMTYKVVALSRIVCPFANIPSTTALASLNTADGRELGLQRGGNVVMPNLTPVKYRALYEIYPNKACIHETAEQCALCLGGRIYGIGRKLGKGPGARVRPAREKDVT